MIAITGSGEIALAVTSLLIQKQFPVKVHGRHEISASDVMDVYESVSNYRSIIFDSTSSSLLVTNGNFNFNQFESLQEGEIDELIESNFTVVANIIQRFLQQTRHQSKRDVFVLGSTAAYDLGPFASVYGASKLALKGLLISLNKEYAKTNTRFSFISLSTVNNSMGKLVPDQLEDTLLDLNEISEEIVSVITRNTNYFEPEIILRRRFIQEHKGK